MFPRIKHAVAALAVVALITGPALAVPTTIVDTTAGNATVDGTINAGEYVGFSTGVGTGFGDVIGDGSELYVDSDLAGVAFGLSTGAGNLDNQMGIYIDSTAGGFNDTASFDDNADPLRAAISGLAADGTGNRSTLTFAPGFEADYAIGVEAGFAGLWQLVGPGSHSFVASADLAPTGDPAAGDFELIFDLSEIGLLPGESFTYVVTYLNAFDAFRSNEFHGVAVTPDANIGAGNFVMSDGDFNTFTTYEEPVDTDDDSWGAVKSLYEN